jgi:hypothetical protein
VTVGPRYRALVALPARVPRLRWAGYAGSAWAALAVPMHLHAGIVAPAGLRPSALLAWRAGHWTAALLLGVVALHTLALVRPWGRTLPAWLPAVGGRRIPSGVMILPAFGIAVLSLGYAVDWFLGRAAGVDPAAGLTGFERGALDLLAWVCHGLSGPWALGLGALVALAVAHYLGGTTARRIWLVVVCLGVLRLVLAFDPLRALGVG